MDSSSEVPAFPGVQMWTKEHDILLCREVLSVNPFSAKRNSNERGKLWEEISTNLNSTSGVRFFVTKRSVRDHLNILIKRYRKKMNAEERSTGVSPEPTELDQALADIIEMEEVASTSQEIDEAVIKEKEDTDKQKAESIRKKAMEKLGETQKRAVEEGEQENHMKKKRRSGNETISFLREKAESEKALRGEELAIRRKQQELEEKKLASYLDQQKSMMELMHHQQQQQSQILMAVVDKLMNQKS
ncbi:mRNA export factor GLE1-like [Montipora capricornis]|uniref:mRNA export factor GLE1-like n=2 Tax=Montipora TaxID=46703 RepID=UPI0035F166FA